MTTTRSAPTGGDAAAPQPDAYTGSDDLLTDLDGARGETRRLLASGYAAAIRDAAADPLTGGELLACLRGADAESRRLVARGYAMCTRDAMNASVVPSACTDPIKRGAGRAWRQSAGIAWLVTALCLSTAVAGWAVSAWQGARTLALQKDFQLSQQAAAIQTLLLEERRYEKDAFINVMDRERTADYAQKWYASRVSLLETITRTSELALTAQDRDAIREVAADFQLYTLGFERVLALIRSGRIRSAQEANEQFAAYKGAVHRIEATCAEISTRALRRLDKTI